RTRSGAQGLAAQDPRGLCISFSTAPYMRALDGDLGKYSPYAQALADALRGTQAVSLEDVLRKTCDSVYRATAKRQVPEYRSALRAQWWFENKGVLLRDFESRQVLPSQPISLQAQTREVAYRPDEPAASAQYARQSVHAWDALDHEIDRKIKQLTHAEARQLMRSLPKNSDSETFILMAAKLHMEGPALLQPDPEAGRRRLIPLANQGHVLAQTLLGESYFSSKVFDQSYKWISLAARSGYRRAQLDLLHLGMIGQSGQSPEDMAEQLKIMLGL
ncbi:MAG: caspase family protein, partial [Comamonas sp.]